MLLRRVKRRIPLRFVGRLFLREHRKLRKELVKEFEKHGVKIGGRHLLRYDAEELRNLRNLLRELEEKHGMTVRDVMNEAVKCGLVPYGWSIDELVRTRLIFRKFPRALSDYVKELAKREAQRILDIAPEVAKLKEIEYEGKKIKLTKDDLASFLRERGLKHAEEIKRRVAEEVLRIRPRELKKEEALAIIERAKKAGVKGVRVGGQRITLEEIEESIRRGDVYAYTDAIEKIKEAVQKSEMSKRRRKVTAKQIGEVISTWMPKGREPAPVVSKDLVHILEKTKEIAAELEKAYRGISAYDVSHVGHANAAEAIHTALHENPKDVIKGMVEAINESIYGNPRARIEKYEIHGSEPIFSVIEKDIEQIVKKYVENLSEKAAKEPEAVIKEMKERAHQIGRELASILLKMHYKGHVNIKAR